MVNQVEAAGLPWWAVLCEGIALIALGLLLLAAPGMTTLIVVQFVGIYWLVAGIFKIVTIFLDRSGWGWKLGGVFLESWPELSCFNTPCGHPCCWAAP